MGRFLEELAVVRRAYRLRLLAAVHLLVWAAMAFPLVPAARGQILADGIAAVVNNKAFPHDKVLDVYWFGAKYTVLSKLDLTAAFYGLRQNSYGEGANAGCKGTQAGTCSGDEKAISFSADYRFTKRFDIYAGGMYSSVQGGLASGFLLNTNNFNPTVGFRFRF